MRKVIRGISGIFIVVVGLVLVLAPGGTAYNVYTKAQEEAREQEESECQQEEEERRQLAELREKSKAEVLAYQQEVDERGIALDMLENPYFMTQMPGYDYPEPEVIEYYSGVTDTYRHATVILPNDYDGNSDKRYPVLYLLHGLGGSHRTWINKDADIILRNLWYFYGAEEMIVVLPNSEVNKEENADDLPSEERVAAYNKTEEDLVNYLMPYIEENFPVKTGREHTAIAGNSMGGRNSVYTAFKHPELFGYLGAFSSARVVGSYSGSSAFKPLLKDLELEEGMQFELCMLMVGRTDDVCGSVTYDLDKRMNKKGIEHIFYDVEGGHQNTVWQNALYNFCLRLFKKV